MDWLQFTAVMVGHLAWPIVAIVVLFTLRDRLSSLADRLIELTFPGGSIKFDKLLQKGAEIVGSNAAPTIEKPLEEPRTTESQNKEASGDDAGKWIRHRTRDSLQGYSLWRTTAAGQILTSYETIESLLSDLAQEMRWPRNNNSKFIHFLTAEGKIGPEIYELYQTLKAGRNVVAHAKALPNTNEIAEYVRQADYLIGILYSLKDTLGKRKKVAGPSS